MNHLHLISTGGTGTYAIEAWGRPNWSSKRVPAHQRSPLIAGEEKQRVLYIFGDPRNQLLSFFRRGFMTPPYTHCQHVGGNVKYLLRMSRISVDSYLLLEYDAYQLYEHLRGWLSHVRRRYDIMFVRYEALHKPEVEKAMRSWVGAEKSFLFKQRKSSFRSVLSTSQQTSINRMFADTLSLTKQLPDVMEMLCS